MAKNAAQTRAKLLDAAEALIFEYGFAGTTVEAIIERAGVTKGAFFHHFPSKTELGHAILERYAAFDTEIKEEVMARAERLSRDPLQQVLLFVGLIEEEMATLSEPFRGCLYASYCYQELLFDARTFELIDGSFRYWRKRLGEKLEEAAKHQPNRGEIDAEGLADMLSVILEGAFILSRTMNEPQLVAKQLELYRRCLELLFGVVDSTTLPTDEGVAERDAPA
jgi:TetR/AcrR family transcriptional repressor of nem operon